jgi:CRP-like cAMP-binding protein
LVCEAAHFKRSVLGSPTLLSAVLRHEQTLYAQAQQSTACLLVHMVGDQFIRLLLRARDLCGEDEIPMTQELMSEILGVRRTSVTEVATVLRASGLITYTRGKIRIVNLAKLKETACECYGAVKSHYSTLLKMKHSEV